MPSGPYLSPSLPIAHPVLNSSPPLAFLMLPATLSPALSLTCRVLLPFFRPFPDLNPRCAHFPPISHHRANSSPRPSLFVIASPSAPPPPRPAASLQLCTTDPLLSIPRRNLCNVRGLNSCREHFRPVMLPIRPKPCESPAFSTRAQIFKDPIFPMYPLSLLARIFTILLFPLQFQKMQRPRLEPGPNDARRDSPTEPFRSAIMLKIFPARSPNSILSQ